MQHVELKLSHKALVLVAVPLAFELMFVATLYLMLSSTEKAVRKAEHAREILSHSEIIRRQLYEAGYALMAFNFIESPSFLSHYDSLVNGTREEFAKLKQLCSSNHEEEMLERKGEMMADTIINQLTDVRNAFEQHNPFFLLRMVYAEKELKVQFRRFELEMNDLIEHEKTTLPSASLQLEEQSRAVLKIILFVGVLLNIILAVSLAIFFNRNTTRRLNQLMQNSVRLARREALLPALKTNDEIGILDRVFHEMADTLTEAARKERAIIDHAVDVICSINADGTFAAVNPAALEVWGFAPEILIGKAFIDIISAEEQSKIGTIMAEVMNSSQPVVFETRIRRDDGRIIDTIWSAHWVESEGRLFSVVHDITARKEVERMKQEFVAMVSHDLRTPLTSTQIFLGMLTQGCYGDVPKMCVDTAVKVESGIDRLISLVNNLLDIEKMDAGMLIVQRRNVPIAKVIDQSIDAVRNFAEQQEVHLFRSDAVNLELNIDPDRIVQVLVNLLSNAIKFSPANSQVSIGAQSYSDYLEVSVIDQGSGIPHEYRKAIFERFRQLESPTSSRKEGSGLGLAICKAIVEQHNGSIGVDGDEGCGSTFWIRLPLNASAAQDDASCPPNNDN